MPHRQPIQLIPIKPPLGHELLRQGQEMIVVGRFEQAGISWTTRYSRHSGGFLTNLVLSRMPPVSGLQLPQRVFFLCIRNLAALISGVNCRLPRPAAPLKDNRAADQGGRPPGHWGPAAAGGSTPSSSGSNTAQTRRLSSAKNSRLVILGSLMLGLGWSKTSAGRVNSSLP